MLLYLAVLLASCFLSLCLEDKVEEIDDEAEEPLLLSGIKEQECFDLKSLIVRGYHFVDDNPFVPTHATRFVHPRRRSAH